MKYLVLIPLLALFFSNVPVQVQMKMPMVKKQSCCSKQQMQHPRCSMAKGKKPSSKKDCMPKQESGCCVCIVCFQFSAPLQQITRYTFDLSQASISYSLYTAVQWSNPYIAAPLRPPDVV